MPDFVAFPKIPRLYKTVIVTEKIDGTNAQVYIRALEGRPETDPACVWQGDGLAIFAGSRKRWVTPESDNYGFAAWVRDNGETLAQLGEGSHFGEWWGRGINRGYNKKDRTFSLFNVSRWHARDTSPFIPYREWSEQEVKSSVEAPACCDVVPVLGQVAYGNFEPSIWEADLIEDGSYAAPGYMNPEGFVVYHGGRGDLFKVILGSNGPKGEQN